MDKSNNKEAQEVLEAIANGDWGVRDQLKRMVEGSFEESGLDPETFMLVRVASLAAIDAAPASWLVNLKVGKELGIPPDKAIGTLIAIAPVIGSARIVSAAGNIAKALGLAIHIKEGR
jgi:hypothetical protein